MAEKNVGGLVVMEGERVVGIITERDYARKIALMGRLSRVNARARHHDLPGDARAPRSDQQGMHDGDDGSGCVTCL